MRRLVGQAEWNLGGEDFRKHGLHFAEKLTQDAGLTAHSRVLDLGSGCGRITIPLTEVIEPSSSYLGLEPVLALVGWCQRAITSRWSHFQFRHWDVRNRLYNREGAVRAETCQFPVDADEFDLIIATSIFTHILPQAAENYIKECARALRPGGHLFATFFLLENGVVSADGILKFAHKYGAAMSIDPILPERAVAYSADWLTERFRRERMRLCGPIRWGSWTGRANTYSSQNVIILEKVK